MGGAASRSTSTARLICLSHHGTMRAMSSLPAISEFVNGLDVFDTHEHIAGFDWGFTDEKSPVGPTHPLKTLPRERMNDMLLCATGAALNKGPSLAPQDWKHEDEPRYWNAIQPAIEPL